MEEGQRDGRKRRRQEVKNVGRKGRREEMRKKRNGQVRVFLSPPEVDLPEVRDEHLALSFPAPERRKARRQGRKKGRKEGGKERRKRERKGGRKGEQEARSGPVHDGVTPSFSQRYKINCLDLRKMHY